MSIKFEIKAKKKAYFFVHPNSGWLLKSNCLDFFLQNVHLIEKYLLPEKLAFSFTTS